MDRGEKLKWREREREVGWGGRERKMEFEFALGQKIYLKLKLKFRSWRVEFHDFNIWIPHIQLFIIFSFEISNLIVSLSQIYTKFNSKSVWSYLLQPSDNL